MKPILIKKKSKRKKIIGIIGSVVILLSMGISFTANLLHTISNEKEMGDIIEEKGITIKALKTIENVDGTISKVFTYQVNPSNATNQAITVSAKFEDNTDCSGVLTVSVNAVAKEITLKCLQDFNKKIKVTLVSSADPTKTAIVTVDYVKKLKEATYNNKTFFLSLKEENDIDYNNFVNLVYSKYTIDKNYSIKFDSLTLTTDEVCVYGGVVSEEIYESIRLYVQNLLENPTTPISKDAIWNISNDNSWHSLLVANTESDSHISFTISNLTLHIVDDDNIIQDTVTIQGREDFIYVYLDCKWDGYVVLVDDISSEIEHIEF